MTSLPTPELQAAVERVRATIPVFYDGTELMEGAKQWAADLRLILAALEERGKALGRAADYLEALEDNLLRNNADMLLDDCESPRTVAEGLRALTALGETPNV